MILFRKLKYYLLLILILTFITPLNAQEKFELSEIKFEGNSVFSASTLSDVIYSKSTPWWFWKFLNSFTSLGKAPAYFDSLYINDDILALQNFYNNNGFFEPNFEYSYIIDSIKKQVSLAYLVTENSPSYHRHIQIYGVNSVYQPLKDEILSVLTFEDGSRYSESNVREKINSVVLMLENNGYMLAKFDSTVIFVDTISNRTDLDIYFSTGRRYQIGEIVVEKTGEGSQLVDAQLLRDIVGIQPFDFYSLEKTRQSQVRLFRTGLFTSVMIIPAVSDTLGTLVPLKISGNIGLLNEISPEIIMNNQQNTFTLGFKTGYDRKNFLGDARKLSLIGSFGIRDFFKTDFPKLIQKFSVDDTTLLGFFEGRIKIEQPYLFNRPIFGTLETYLTINKDNSSNSRNFGGKLSFEFEMPSHTFVSYLTTYYNLEVVDETFFINRLFKDLYNIEVGDLKFRNTLSIIGVDARSSKTDNLLFPTRGYNLSILFEEANSIPYFISKLSGSKQEDPSFYKALLTSAFYYSINKNENSIVAQKIKIGYIQPYDGSVEEIPSTRKYYSGGSNSIRGWRARQLSPVTSVPIDVGAVEIGTIILGGGTFMFEGSTEWRFRDPSDIGFAVFIDYGNSFEGYESFRYDQIAVAAGLGARYYTSFAPFRVDFGFKVYDPEDRRSFFKKSFFSAMEFHFGIGEAF